MAKHSQVVKWTGEKNVYKFHSPLKTVVHCKGKTVENVIIALHGFGDHALNFSSFAESFPIENLLWVFPEAPYPVSVGEQGRQWFSLFANPTEERRASENLLWELQENIIQELDIPSHKLFFLGFSQGAAMALSVGLKLKKRFAGILSLSGFLTEPHALKNAYAGAHAPDTPVMLTHGMQDMVLFPLFFYEIQDTLKDLRIKKLQVKTYPKMAHTVGFEAIADISRFIGEHR